MPINQTGLPPRKKDPLQDPTRPLQAPNLPAQPAQSAQPSPSAQPAQQAQNNAAPPPVDARGAPGTFTNFSRRFNANKDVAEREAGKYAGQATAAVGNAANVLGTAKTNFAAGVNTGSVAPPPAGFTPSQPTIAGAPFQTPAKTARNGALAGNALQDALNPAPAATQPGSSNVPTSNALALSSESTRGSTSQAVTGDPTQAVPPPAPTMADMLAQAGQKYTGPTGLDTAAATTAAQSADQQLNALSSRDPLLNQGGVQALVQANGTTGSEGASALSGSLIGAAGRQNFDALRAKFNPNKDLNDAQTAAMKTAADAKLSSDANAKGWGAAAGQAQSDQDAATAQSAKDAADKKAKTDAMDKAIPTQSYDETYGNGKGGDTDQNRVNYMMQGIDSSDPAAVAKRVNEIGAYSAAMGMTTQNQLDQTFADFNSVFSPSSAIAQASGNKDPTQTAAQNQYGFLNADHPGNQIANANASGSTSAMHIPWDKAGPDGFFVWKSMTPNDWQVLNSKPSDGPNGQQAWIKTRGQQLRSEANPNSTKSTTGASLYG